MNKVCPICGNEFEPKHGNQKYCSRECVRVAKIESVKTYYQTHKEQRKVYKKAYYQAHKVQCKAYHKAYYRTHKEQYKVYNKAYYQTHKKQRKSYSKAYYYAHKKAPEYVIKVCLTCGSEFKTKPGNKKYCSPECARVARNKHWRENYKNFKQCKKEHDNCFSCPTLDGECLYDYYG